MTRPIGVLWTTAPGLSRQPCRRRHARSGASQTQGFPETLLNRYALDKKIDLPAVGTHGRHPMLDRLFGSTSAALILSSPCDTLLVPKPTDESPAEGFA